MNDQGLLGTKSISAKFLAAAGILCLALLLAGPDRVFSAPPRQTNGLHKGDVLAGVDRGRIYQFGPDGRLLGILDTASGEGSVAAGMCFDSSGSLYVTTFDNNGLSKFDSAGALLNSSFAVGLSEPESCVVDAAQNIYVGQAGGDQQIIKLDPSGKFIGSFSPATEKLGTGWITLDPDQCTMFYTSGGSGIKRFDVCKAAQLPDFTTQPLAGPCYEVRIRPNGEVMVACASQVYRLDSFGNVIQTYTDFGNGALFALSLDPDGTSFWTADINSATIYRLDIASGKQMVKPFRADASKLGGLAVVGEIAAQLQPPVPLTPPPPTPVVPTPLPPAPPQEPISNPLPYIVGGVLILLVLGGILVVAIVVIVFRSFSRPGKKDKPEQKRSSGRVEKHEDIGSQVVEVESGSARPTSSIRLHLVHGQADTSIETEPPKEAKGE
jgi:DNA-binding beta-propeller fold protein YncE